MTVYVDSMKAPYGRMVMCHMIADDEAELHAMADKVGVARKWHQGNHYDIASSKRALAVSFGAVEITWTQCGLMVAVAKRLGFMPSPAGAKQSYKAMMSVRRLVVHCKRAEFDVYVGRPSIWGNPFAIGRDGTRLEVIRKYCQRLVSNPHLWSRLPELRGQRLGCW